MVYTYTTMVGIVQLVRASDCGSECRGFESHYPPFSVRESVVHMCGHPQMGHRQAVRHSTLTATCAGSNPAGPVKVTSCLIEYGILAQVVEHLTFNQVVRGSSPRCLIKREKRQVVKTCLFSLLILRQRGTRTPWVQSP